MNSRNILYKYGKNWHKYQCGMHICCNNLGRAYCKSTPKIAGLARMAWSLGLQPLVRMQPDQPDCNSTRGVQKVFRVNMLDWKTFQYLYTSKIHISLELIWA